MNTPIVHWPVMRVHSSSIQALEHMTIPSLRQQSSIDHPVSSILDTISPQPSAAPNCNDGVWVSAGPYDDDEETELEEDML